MIKVILHQFVSALGEVCVCLCVCVCVCVCVFTCVCLCASVCSCGGASRGGVTGSSCHASGIIRSSAMNNNKSADKNWNEIVDECFH